MPELSSADVILLLLVGVGLGLFLIVAQLRLFSIDRSLKAILSKLRGNIPEKKQPKAEVIERLRQQGRLPKDSTA